MTRTELINRITDGQPHLNPEDMEIAVKTMLDQVRATLMHGGRIEIRAFGAFSLRRRASQVGRNPSTGAPVALSERHEPHFLPGKELRERVDIHAAAWGLRAQLASMGTSPDLGCCASRCGSWHRLWQRPKTPRGSRPGSAYLLPARPSP
jgi:integration host factor subunit beta